MSTLMLVKVVGLLLAGIVFVVWQLRSVERDLRQSRERRRLAHSESESKFESETKPEVKATRNRLPRSEASGDQGLH